MSNGVVACLALCLGLVSCSEHSRPATLDGADVSIIEKKSGGHVDVVIKLGRATVVHGRLIDREPVGVWKRFAANGTEVASGDYTGWKPGARASFLPDGLTCAGDDGATKPAIKTSTVCDKYRQGVSGSMSTGIQQTMTCTSSREVKAPGCSAFPAELFYAPDELGALDAAQKTDLVLRGLDKN